MSDLYIIRSKKEESYKTIKLTCTEDIELSWKAKGIHTYLISRPPNWKIWKTDLLKRSKDGRESLESGIKELKKFGYLYSFIVKNREGKFISGGYFVLEIPEKDSRLVQEYLNEATKDEPDFTHKIRTGRHDEDKNSGLTEIRESSITENQPYSNNSTINNKNLYISKDIVPPKADSICSSPSFQGEDSLYVEFWNGLSSTPKHKKIKKDGSLSKTYKNAHSFCLSLKKGNLSKKTGSLDEKFMRRNGLLSDMLSKKWTDEEIFEGLTRLNKLYSAEYAPYNKKTLPKNLPDMIYNPRTKTSMFLAVMKNDPIPISDQCQPILLDVYGMYLDLMKEFNMRPEEELTLKKQVNILIGKQRYIESQIAPYQNSGFISDFGAKNNYFYQTHIKWLVDCFGQKGLTPSMITSTWRAYVRWAQRFLGYDIDPSAETLNEWKLKARKQARERKTQEKFRGLGQQAKLEWLANQAL